MLYTQYFSASGFLGVTKRIRLGLNGGDSIERSGVTGEWLESILAAQYCDETEKGKMSSGNRCWEEFVVVDTTTVFKYL